MRLEHPLLLGGRQPGVERQHFGVLQVPQRFGGVADLALSGEEHQHIAGRLRRQFGDADSFMAMVRQGYPMVVRPASTVFFQPALADGAVLETGCVYLVPLLETLALPDTIAASTNPKSSTGRLDIFTRVMTDRGHEFDKVPAGYAGPLYLEVSPRTFPIVVRTGSRLSLRTKMSNLSWAFSCAMARPVGVIWVISRLACG